MPGGQVLLWSRADLVLRLASIVASNIFIPNTNKEVEDSCLTSTFRIATLRCSLKSSSYSSFTLLKHIISSFVQTHVHHLASMCILILTLISPDHCSHFCNLSFISIPFGTRQSEPLLHLSHNC